MTISAKNKIVLSVFLFFAVIVLVMTRVFLQELQQFFLQ